VDEFEAILPRHVETEDPKLSTAIAKACEQPRAMVSPVQRTSRSKRALAELNMAVVVSKRCTTAHLEILSAKLETEHGIAIYHICVADTAARQIQVTAYEAGVHCTRQLDVPGVLGGLFPPVPCPDQ
jgi:hypothetical protein